MRCLATLKYNNNNNNIDIATGAVFIFIAAASPNKASLGATNGLSQVCPYPSPPPTFGLVANRTLTGHRLFLPLDPSPPSTPVFLMQQTTVSMMRAIGPAIATSLFSMTVEHGYLHGQLVYLVLLLIVAASVFCATLLPKSI